MSSGLVVREAIVAVDVFFVVTVVAVVATFELLIRQRRGASTVSVSVSCLRCMGWSWCGGQRRDNFETGLISSSKVIVEQERSHPVFVRLVWNHVLTLLG